MTWVAMALSLLLSSISNAASIEDFSRHSQFYNVKISPDGKHLAVLMNVEGRKTLAFMRTSDQELSFVLNPSTKSQPGEYFWVNNERVVTEIELSSGSLESPYSLGELMAVNYDGKKKKMIFGYRSKSGLAFSAYGGELLHSLPNDRKNILITRFQLAEGGQAVKAGKKDNEVYKLNVYSGKTRRIKGSPVPSNSFVVDRDGVPRFVAGLDKDFNNKLFYSEGKGKPWKPFNIDIKGDFEPIGFDGNSSVYAYKSSSGEPQGFYKYDLETQKETLLFQSPLADPTHSLRLGEDNIFGLRIDEDYPGYWYTRQDHAGAALHKVLVRAFNNQKVTITSKTKNNEKIVIHVSGDQNPGEFYLFDTKTMKAQFLLARKRWLKSDDLLPMEAFRIKTEDGFTLNGYLTLPKGKSSNHPTVVMPHGGPHARDYWGYQPDVQMLANAGYAVLQINFRGSDGYGKEFLKAGYGHWGTKIQDDITLAARYAINNGIADKSRICIYGASFGGYSALQSAIREPDLYQCAIGYVGVYDLPLMYKEGDIKDVVWGDAYLNKTLGTDQQSLREQSPALQTDSLKAPVFIIHGKKDVRAHYEHAEVLKAALDKKGHEYEWLVKEKEGHGFYNEANRLELNQKVLQFLNKHIGS
ncbi:MAG: alpha/beta hydrolase family protein [Endozoicomonas sp.]|uniref:alpha/beta hydrolase family protein n=1 Tax=Endozoicomonas sp. TaxID=1892382 RepID=UPI003D9BA6E5